MKVRKLLLTSKRNRPYLRSKKAKYVIDNIEGIVIHWTANTDKRADAVANRNYFNSTNTYASAHYIVDDKNIVQCIPDNEVAWHVGDFPKLSNLPRRKEIKNKKGPNYALIGVEMCVNKDGDWVSTYNRSISLVRSLMKKHNLGIDQIYRHYDITGKDCPIMFLPTLVKEVKYDYTWKLLLSDLMTKEGNDLKVIEKRVVVEKEYTVNELISKMLKKIWPLAK